MRTIELMEQMLNVADQLGYGIRYEWLGGASGGACELRGKKWIFVDLALSANEQLEQVGAALKADPAIHLVHLPPVLLQHLELRRAA